MYTCIFSNVPTGNFKKKIFIFHLSLITKKLTPKDLVWLICLTYLYKINKYKIFLTNFYDNNNDFILNLAFCSVGGKSESNSGRSPPPLQNAPSKFYFYTSITKYNL